MSSSAKVEVPLADCLTQYHLGGDVQVLEPRERDTQNQFAIAKANMAIKFYSCHIRIYNLVFYSSYQICYL